jgi:hypothetical protein
MSRIVCLLLAAVALKLKDVGLLSDDPVDWNETGRPHGGACPRFLASAERLLNVRCD